MKDKKIFNYILLWVIMFSCNNKPKAISKEEACYTNDSIIYILSGRASEVLDSFAEGKKYCYVGLVSCSENNEYIFSIRYTDCGENVSNRKSYLMRVGNRFLKTKKNLFHILLDEDDCFANAPKDSIRYFVHGEYGFIKVNSKGEFLDGFSYDKETLK